jgi:hypothetical protein
MNALTNELLNGVFDIALVTVVNENGFQRQDATMFLGSAGLF